MGPAVEIPVVPRRSSRDGDLLRYARTEFRDATLAWLIADGARPVRRFRLFRRGLSGKARMPAGVPAAEGSSSAAGESHVPVFGDTHAQCPAPSCVD